MTLSIDEFTAFYCGLRSTRMDPIELCRDCGQAVRDGHDCRNPSPENPPHYRENGLKGFLSDNGDRKG